MSLYANDIEGLVKGSVAPATANSLQVSNAGELFAPFASNVAGLRGLALHTRVMHTARQYANGKNTPLVPAWSRLDVGARYLIDIGSNRLPTLRRRIDNVLKKSYRASAGGDPGADYLVLGAPRTLVVSGSVDF